jgi:hypothetical protein
VCGSGFLESDRECGEEEPAYVGQSAYCEAMFEEWNPFQYNYFIYYIWTRSL